MLTGRRPDGTEAADRGVVTEALSDEAVYGRAAGLADELGSNSAAALAAVKKSVNAAFPRPIDDTMWDLELARSLAKGEDFAEGKQAFVEGRQPDFRE